MVSKLTLLLKSKEEIWLLAQYSDFNCTKLVTSNVVILFCEHSKNFRLSKLETSIKFSCGLAVQLKYSKLANVLRFIAES